MRSQKQTVEIIKRDNETLFPVFYLIYWLCRHSIACNIICVTTQYMNPLIIFPVQSPMAKQIPCIMTQHLETLFTFMVTEIK